MEDIHDQNSAPAWAVEDDVGFMLETAIFVEGTPKKRTFGQQFECFIKRGEVGIRPRRTEVLESVTVDRFQLTVRDA